MVEASLGLPLRLLPELSYPNDFHPRFSRNWLKLRLWELEEEFDRILLLDADMAVTEDVARGILLEGADGFETSSRRREGAEGGRYEEGGQQGGRRAGGGHVGGGGGGGEGGRGHGPHVADVAMAANLDKVRALAVSVGEPAREKKEKRGDLSGFMAHVAFCR
jgi:hypothetical protein